MQLIPVTFVKDFGNYHIGQTASFLRDQADKFIALNIAVPVAVVSAPTPQKSRLSTVRDKIIRKG